MTGERPPRVLIDEARLRLRVQELAVEVRRDTPPGAPLHLVAALKGAFVFLADFVRALQGPVTVDFLSVGSYDGRRETSGQIRITKDIEQSIENRDVVLVEDILDTGLTLAAVHELLQSRRPRSLRTVCLLDKPARRRVDIPVDYVGFTIDDHFVVGYGLDAGELYRNLPYVGILEPGS
jgi:hypoxanthine phosphoribosyltransferase